MKILYIGTVKFSERCLQKLISCSAHVVGICTLSYSDFNSDYVDLSPIANKHQIPLRITPDINSQDTLDWIRSLNPDVIFCFGWSQMIHQSLLQIPRIGTIGFHPSALPLNRGRHPIIWSLVLGLKETASTFFFMDAGADSGDILSQVSVPIYHCDTALTLYDRIIDVAISQVSDFLPKLSNNTYTRTPQNHCLSNVWRKRGFPDGQIDWRMSAESIYNLVRGLTHPYIGAHFLFRSSIFKVWRADIEYNVPVNLEPGKILHSIDHRILVKTGSDAIWLLETTPSIHLNVGDYL